MNALKLVHSPSLNEIIAKGLSLSKVHPPIYAPVLRKTGQQHVNKASGSVCVHTQEKKITVVAKLH